MPVTIVHIIKTALETRDRVTFSRADPPSTKPHAHHTRRHHQPVQASRQGTTSSSSEIAKFVFTELIRLEHGDPQSERTGTLREVVELTTKFTLLVPFVPN